MTGSTDTSIWKNYQNGVRVYCGHPLAEGMTKNQKLPMVLLTPTTKEEGHDRPIALADIVKEGWMTQADLDVCADAALKLFARGQQIAAQRGLVLVDTKYEFGKDVADNTTIRLIDEIHTPDSSRYWLASSVEERVAQGLEPENIDKEFLRLWFRDRCDPYDTNAVLPEAPRDLVIELSKRYILLYEMITWEDFPFRDVAAGEDAIAEILRAHLTATKP
jgi:phosphoribosylaminoimidazole-succinocarboxamide synthase